MSALLITGLRLFYKEYVLTPRGKDMNPELGPVVAASPGKKAITSLLLLATSTGFFNCLRKRKVDTDEPSRCPGGTMAGRQKQRDFIKT